jgi:hypothetical protein
LFRDRDFDEEKVPWKEIEAQIPSYPRPENLIPFEASAASPHRYYIDSASVSLGEDGVTRYTLVVRAAGGATNVTYEGVRCETREQKYYATGRTSGWSRARDPQWRRIEDKAVNRHHYVLYKDFFCPAPRAAATPRQVLEALRRESRSLR